MATRGSVRPASCDTGTEAPPANPRERPSAETVRASSRWSSSTSPPSSSTLACVSEPTRSTPSIRALLAPARTAPASPRPPSRRPRAVTIMVLPAPVSPVMQVSPGPNSRVLDSITPRELILSSSSIAGLPGATPAGDWQPELRDQPVGERLVAQPHQADRPRAAAYLDPSASGKVDGAPAVAPQHAGAVGLGDELERHHRVRRDH